MSNTNSERNDGNLTWTGLVFDAVEKKELLGSTCHLYSMQQTEDKFLPKERCLCGRHRRRHSFQGKSQTEPLSSNTTYDKFEHATEVPVTVYGILPNRTKFVRWDHTRVQSSVQKTKTSLSTMARIILADARNEKPDLLISCYGGAKYFKMTEKLTKEFMDGIGRAAVTKGVWLLSTGLNSGVSKVIGQSIRRYALLNDQPPKHTLIGLSSWGCLSDRTHQVFRQQAKLDLTIEKNRRTSIVKMNAPLMTKRENHNDDNVSTLDDDEPDTLESNHTHFLLLDDGSQGECMTSKKRERVYIADTQRSTFVNELTELTQCHAMTIIIEGGLYSLDVIENDISAKRPVVIIHGSGRLATAIGNLLELIYHHGNVGTDEIERQLKTVIVSMPTENCVPEIRIKQTEFILSPANQPYLSVFRPDDNTSLTDTIFLAVFKAQMHQANEEKTNNKDDKGADRIKKVLDLAVTWNSMNGITDILENKETINYDPKWNVDLFEKAVIHNRPVYVDYFLRRQHDVLETSSYINFNKTRHKKSVQLIETSLGTTTSLSSQSGQDRITIQSNNNEHEIPNVDDINVRLAFCRKFVIEKLYDQANKHLKESYRVHSLIELDSLYYRLIGPYTESFFRIRSTKDRTQIDLRSKLQFLFTCFNRCKRNSSVSPAKSLGRRRLSQIGQEKRSGLDAIISITRPDPLQEHLERFAAIKTFGHQEMLRDIFLWAVIEGHCEMAFVLLLQLRCRIIAALLAAGITKRLMSTNHGYLDRLHKFKKQSNDYTQFATACIDVCYKKNERRACQLLLREIPLFGNITCMQAAVAFRIKAFINSRCFDQVLTRQWYGALDQTTNRTFASKLLFLISLLSLGLLAPVLLTYRNDELDNNDKQKKVNTSAKDKRLFFEQRWEGVEDQDNTNENYFQKIRKFHRTPIVRMCYDFFIYIWMLLAFSNMMLFEMKSENAPPHWTEIYVIVAISTMLIEDIRKIITEYHTQMMERWHQSDLGMAGVYVLPYILFYIGIGLQFGSRIRPDLFTAARIVLALDLELWFLFSLRFVSAVKLLGPKLFMIRNMLKDLVGFIYIIFVCIAAYGIVSRSLTMYSSVTLDAKNLSAGILYRPYWFLYSIVDAEMADFDNIINSESSTTDAIAEATTNQILLAFHMLFINILVLNLLIAVFNFTINDIQEKSEYFWRYQRYELIREYFEQPTCAYPPLSILAYVYLSIKWCVRRRTGLRVFKRYATQKMTADWTDFEHDATDSYTSDFVDRMYCDSSTLVVPTFSEIDELKAEIESLKRKGNQMHGVVNTMNTQLKQTVPAINWMMTAMDRVKMSSQRPPPLVSTTTSEA